MFRPKDRERCQQLFEKYYAGRKFSDALYRDAINRYLSRGDRLLDAGCGTYMKFCKELANGVAAVGIDLESTLETNNRHSPFGVRGDLNKLPFASDHFDMVISRSVVEHLSDPELVFREFSRVLRPGGKLVIVTPNKYDYVSLIAAVTPYWLHRSLVSRIFQVPADDVYPTLYKANTASALSKALMQAGFKKCELSTINHYPAYLMFSPVLFRMGILYERLTSLEIFRSLRGSILCVFEKTARSSAIPARKLPAHRNEHRVEVS
jgi:SAM-dependent methyltransferase